MLLGRLQHQCTYRNQGNDNEEKDSRHDEESSPPRDDGGQQCNNPEEAKVTKLGIGGVLIAAALFLAIFVLNLFLFGIVALLATVVSWWAAFFIVTGVLLLVVIALIAVGVVMLKASQKHVVDPKGAITEDIGAIKKGLNR